ncbi:MAG: DNA methyltransferase [Pseudomonadota bacterium]
MLNHGFSLLKNPILRPLETIEQRDALINPDGTEAEWPQADVIIGNPPFLGDRKMIGELGEEYVIRIRGLYKGRVPGGADLVTYWFEKALAQIEATKAKRAGLVATNSIRGGANRKVLDRIGEIRQIFNAWSDEPWINDGAAVRVSLVCFGNMGTPPILDGQPVTAIHADLTAQTLNSSPGGDLTQAKRLAENAKISFIGTQKNGPFDISGELARQWLKLPNPHGKPNSDVLCPWSNGMDVTRRPSDTWIIDFGCYMSAMEAELYEAPFFHVIEHVKPTRLNLRRQFHRTRWWLHGDPRPALRRAVADNHRYIATSAVSKHRLFAWVDTRILADHALIVIARSDNTTFGVLHSRFHELWSLGLCTWLGKGNDPRYTPTTTFETFPFPENILHDPAPDTRYSAIATAARRLNELRENWLNPPEWVERVPEVVPGYPDRILPKSGFEAELKKRTLTNLYNQRPAWLDNAHKTLDRAVASAYGWTDYTDAMPDEEILRRLLALNLARAGQSPPIAKKPSQECPS